MEQRGISPRPDNKTRTHIERKEQKQENVFDTLIVFGQGPVKPVLLQSELTADQAERWQHFRKNPLKNTEPDFRVIEGRHAGQIDTIQQRTDVSDAEKKRLVEEKRNEFQHMGRFALNRWGRQNALAAGVSLLSGVTGSIILSGGKTIPEWAREKLPRERLSSWPSEAELMQDIIVRTFGDFYEKKFGRQIQDAVHIEDASKNTLENFAFTLNNQPDLLNPDKRIGLLATDFHIRRVTQLAHLFTLNEEAEGQVSAQSVLKKRVPQRREAYGKMLFYMTNTLENPDLRDRLFGEQRFERGLIDPEFLTYWLGYIGDVEDPKVVRYIINNMGNPSWINSARNAFEKAGLHFDEYKEADISQLKEAKHDKYTQLMDGLRKLKSSEYRSMPPPVL